MQIAVSSPNLFGFFSWAKSTANTISKNLKHRKLARDTMKELYALSDAELSDIGIHRSQIRSIALNAEYL